MPVLPFILAGSPRRLADVGGPPQRPLGTILLDGEGVTRQTPAQMIADRVTYVLQGPNVVPNLSVLHNIELRQTRVHDRAAAPLADPRVGQLFRDGHIEGSAA